MESHNGSSVIQLPSAPIETRRIMVGCWVLTSVYVAQTITDAPHNKNSLHYL